MSSTISHGQPLPPTLLESSKPRYARPTISSNQLLSATAASLLAFATLIIITLQLNPHLTPAKNHNNPQVAGLSTQRLTAPRLQQSDFFIPTPSPETKNPYTRTPPPQTEITPHIQLD